MRRTKVKLGISLAMIILTIAMLTSSTYAWYTDSVSNTGNKIQAGSLKVELWRKGDESGTKITEEGYTDYYNISNSSSPIFSYDKWEPGYAMPVSLVVANTGNLAVNYNLYIDITESLDGLDQLEAEYTDKTDTDYLAKKAILEEYQSGDNADKKLEDVLIVYNCSSRKDCSSKNNLGILSSFKSYKPISEGVLEAGERKTIELVILLPAKIGNEYMNAGISFDIKLAATQSSVEKDSFDNNLYDFMASDFLQVGKSYYFINSDDQILGNARLVLEEDPSYSMLLSEIAEQEGWKTGKNNYTRLKVENLNKDMYIGLFIWKEANQIDIVSDYYGDGTVFTWLGTTFRKEDRKVNIEKE